MTDLLDMKAAAEYCAIDYETFRQYVARGMVATVRYPSLVDAKKGRPRRKKLFRRESLDAFIQQSEQQPAGTKTGTLISVPRTGNYGKGWQDEVRARTGR